MSYSLAPVRGGTVAAVLAALSAAFDEKVLPGQPIHAHDKQAHLDAVERQLTLLPAPGPDQEYSASMGGYLSWLNEPIPAGAPTPAPKFITAGFNCSVDVVAKEAPKA